LIKRENINWHRLDWTIHDLPWNENNLCTIKVADKAVTLALFHEKLYAFTTTCPHAGALFVSGIITADGCIQCPLHKYRFQLSNGFNLSGEGYHMATFPILFKGNQIFIGLPANR